MPIQQNLSLNESGSIQYGAYGCYGRTALNPWLTVDGIKADHQHVFVSRFDIIWLLAKLKLKLKLKNKSKRKSHCWRHYTAKIPKLWCRLDLHCYFFSSRVIDVSSYRKVSSTRAVGTRLRMDLIQRGEWRWAFSRTSPSDRHGLTSFPAGAGRTMYEIRQLIHCTLKLAVTSGIVHMVHMCIKLSNPILAAQYVTNRLLVFCSASYSTRVSVRLYWYTILAFGIGLQ